MDISQYKQKIDAGKSINFTRFITLLPTVASSNVSRYYKAKKISAHKYEVTVLDQEFHQSLGTTKPTNRLEAAEQGNSHAAKLSFAHILVWSNEQAATPDVVVLSDDGLVKTPFNTKKKLLLIENQECFFRLPQMLNGLYDFSHVDINLDDFDIGLGNGDAVSNALLAPYFSKYDFIVCAFDFDMAGLQMYHGLKEQPSLAICQIDWLVPSDLRDYYSLFRLNAQTADRLLSAIDLADSLSLPQVSEAFRQTKHFMEQEMLLLPLTTGQ